MVANKSMKMKNESNMIANKRKCLSAAVILLPTGAFARIRRGPKDPYSTNSLSKMTDTAVEARPSTLSRKAPRRPIRDFHLMDEQEIMAHLSSLGLDSQLRSRLINDMMKAKKMRRSIANDSDSDSSEVFSKPELTVQGIIGGEIENQVVESEFVENVESERERESEWGQRAQSNTDSDFWKDMGQLNTDELHAGSCSDDEEKQGDAESSDDYHYAEEKTHSAAGPHTKNTEVDPYTKTTEVKDFQVPPSVFQDSDSLSQGCDSVSQGCDSVSKESDSNNILETDSNYNSSSEDYQDNTDAMTPSDDGIAKIEHEKFEKALNQYETALKHETALQQQKQEESQRSYQEQIDLLQKTYRKRNLLRKEVVRQRKERDLILQEDADFERILQEEALQEDTESSEDSSLEEDSDDEDAVVYPSRQNYWRSIVKTNENILATERLLTGGKQEKQEQETWQQIANKQWANAVEKC